MALSLSEELQILEGIAEPTDNFVGTTNFNDMVLQSAYGWAINFIKSYKDTSANVDATNYRDKVLQTSRRLIANASAYVESLSRALVAVYGETGDFSTVTSSDRSQWETFVDNNINEVVEAISEILIVEKTAYDAI